MAQMQNQIFIVNFCNYIRFSCCD